MAGRIFPGEALEIHQLAESLGAAIDAKDHHTHLHSEQTAVAAEILARGLGLSTHICDRIHIAGHLHDIGKIGLPDRILQKPGPLSDREWLEIKKHPIRGAEILAPVDYLRLTGITEMVRRHHESFDGQGYPDGLAGKEIPLGARIIAVADSLSAILQDRPYRPGASFGEAVNRIQLMSGIRYDPRVVDVLIRRAEQIKRAIPDWKMDRPGFGAAGTKCDDTQPRRNNAPSQLPSIRP